MAYIAYKPLESGQGYQLLLWEGLNADDEGTAFDGFANSFNTPFTNFTIQVEGVFEGATVEISGSVIPDKFNVLETFTVSDIKRVPPVDRVKPYVIGGNRETRVTIGLLATR